MNKIRKFFRRGNGELLGFAAIMPMFIVLMTFIVAIAQIALAKEKMEYIAYACGRAAVVAEDVEQGMEKAQEIIDNSDTNYQPKVEFIINGQTITPSNVHSLTGVSWYKGQQLTVVVTYNIPVIGNLIFSSNELQDVTTTTIMMIERPAQ